MTETATERKGHPDPVAEGPPPTEPPPKPGDSDVSMNHGSVAAGSSEEPPVHPEMALAIREERDIAQPPAASLPSEREWQATLAVARQIAATPFVPEPYRGQPEAVVAAILTGRELGIGPMQSLREIHMIDGRAVFSATLMLSQLRRGGVRILESVSTNERAFIRAQRDDTGETAEAEWTFEEASKIRRKGKALTDGDNWKNYPGDMLWARAVGRLARRLGSDLLGGMVYTREEMQDLEGFEGGYEEPADEPVPWETIDPGVRMHPDAPKDWKQIRMVLDALDSSRDWTLLVRSILQERYGVPTPKELGASEKEAGKRLANMAGYLADVLMDGKEFPPPNDAEISEAIQWAFSGLSLPEETLEATAKPLEPDEVEPGQDAALTAEEAAEMAAAEDAQIEFGEEATGDRDD